MIIVKKEVYSNVCINSNLVISIALAYKCQIDNPQKYKITEYNFVYKMDRH